MAVTENAHSLKALALLCHRGQLCLETSTIMTTMGSLPRPFLCNESAHALPRQLVGGRVLGAVTVSWLRGLTESQPTQVVVAADMHAAAGRDSATCFDRSHAQKRTCP